MAMPGLLLYRRRRMGRVVPGMYDLNLSRAKDRMLAQAVRELAWERANHPSKCPVKRGAFSAAASPIRYFDGALPRLRVSVSDNRSRARLSCRTRRRTKSLHARLHGQSLSSNWRVNSH
jgi:hypothetical protein